MSSYPNFMEGKRYMGEKMKLMLQHILQSPFFISRLISVDIWGDIFISLFEYKLNCNPFKAMLSFWNRTHTILTKTGEMRIALLDMKGIGRLPTYGKMYEEHIPSQDVVGDALLRDLISIRISLLQTSTNQHNKKTCFFQGVDRGIYWWSNIVGVMLKSSRLCRSKRPFGCVWYAKFRS